MRVLQIHNRYRHRGGEDQVFDDEIRLLAEHGHEVRSLERSNEEIADQPTWRSAAGAVWSRENARALDDMAEAWRPDLVHIHNTFPLMSPSVIWAASRRGLPIVATLHNFRLMCLEGTFMREGQACERCLGRTPLPGVAAGCYRGSRMQSGVLAASLMAHRALGTWRRRVHRFIALSPLSVDKFVAAGLPAERIRIKANFAWAAPNAANAAERTGGLYVGRLTEAKGIHLLAEALRRSPGGSPFTVIGDGPAGSALDGLARLIGFQRPEAVQRHMLAAAFLVIPSMTWEQFPRVLAEAYAAGLPVIAASLGPLAALVRDGETGLLYRPGDAGSLARRIAWAQDNPQRMAEMGRSARAEHASRMSPAAAYERQMSIYEEAIATARAERLAWSTA